MKLSRVDKKKIFFLFIGFSLLFLSFTNIQKIEFNLLYICDQILSFGANNIFLIITHPLIVLALLCVLDIAIGIIALMSVVAVNFLNIFNSDELNEILIGTLIKLPISSMIVCLIDDPVCLNKEGFFDLLRLSVLLFISGGLFFISIFGQRGFACIAFFFYILILIKIRSNELPDLISINLSENVVHGLPYLMFIPYTVYLFGLQGAVIGCLFLCIINYFILHKNLFPYYDLHSYVNYSLAYLLLVPILTYFGGIVGTIIGCLIIYLCYTLIDRHSNKGLSQEYTITLNKIFTKIANKVDPDAS